MAKQQQQQGKKGGGGGNQQQQGKRGGGSGGGNQQQAKQEQQEQGNEKKFQAIIIGELFSDAFEAVSDTPILMPIGTTAVRMIDHCLELLSTSNILDVTIACSKETSEKVSRYLEESPRWKNFLKLGGDEGGIKLDKHDKHDQQEKMNQLEIKFYKTPGENIGRVIRDICGSGIITTKNFVLVYIYSSHILSFCYFISLFLFSFVALWWCCF